MGVLPLFVFLAACTGPVVNLEEPAEVDSCERLIPVGIELVNDYVYTLAETDLGATDPEALPASLIALNTRGQELDARAAELECDLDVLNRRIVESTEVIESDDPVVAAFLETVRGGVVAVASPVHGTWQLDAGAVVVEGYPITLEIGDDAAQGSAGCNGYYMPVVLGNGVWAWGEGAATITQLTCNDDLGEPLLDVASSEAAYMRTFETVVEYSLQGDTLVLTGPEVELRFIRLSSSSAGD
ncbi:MAG: META domain-containing protein [bacterium]|nr:META domain-containing protein [bacterium]